MKLQKEVDRLEDEWAHEKDKYKAITDEMDQVRVCSLTSICI